MSADQKSINGTIEDVAAFFRVSVRTVAGWKAEKAIGFFQHGRNVMFGEEDVVAFKAGHYLAVTRMQPGEATERARREWRAHMGVPYEGAALRMKLDQLSDRLAALDAKVLLLTNQRTDIAA